MEQKEKDTAGDPKPKLKVLQVHCEYLQEGGEDKVVREEAALLKRGYELSRFIRPNGELLDKSPLRQLFKAIWNREVCASLQQCLSQYDPDVIHVHNTFALLSPAVFRVLGRWKRRRQRQGKHTKILYTLHNFRLHCPQASLMRPLRAKGRIIGHELCQRCFAAGHFGPAVRSRCYRDSWAMTWAVACMLTVHKYLKSWQKNVDHFIYLNSTQKNLLSRVGFPEEKFIYKPNFLSLPATQMDRACDVGPKLEKTFRLLFAGRLSEEKGLRVLLAAMRQLRNDCGVGRDIELRIAGDGPLKNELQEFIAAHSVAATSSGQCRLQARGKDSQPQGPEQSPQQVSQQVPQQVSRIKIEYLGRMSQASLEREFQRCHFLILPSIWYEGMPMTILEALAAGRPVISFCLGASAELLHHQVNGILAAFFRNPQAQRELRLSDAYSNEELIQNISAAIKAAASMDQECYDQMCRAARSRFLQDFTAERNLELLRNIYESR